MVPTHSSTGSQHVHAVSHLLAHEGAYGVVSQLSQHVGVSRQTLYSWKGKGRRALEAAFEPTKLAVPIQLERAVLTLLVEGHASYRGIQRCLAVLLQRFAEVLTDKRKWREEKKTHGVRVFAEKWKSMSKERWNMKAYSQDLRQRILQTLDEGKTQAEAAHLLKVSETTVKRYVRQRACQCDSDGKVLCTI